MIVLYTAVLGGCDSIKHAPHGPDACVCFTDEMSVSDGQFYRGWQILHVAAAGRARREARILKMTPHEQFPEYDASVWVDGSIQINDWPKLMRDAKDASIACFSHPDRSDCYSEGDAVVRLKIAHRAKVLAALELYRRDGFAPSTLSTTGLFYRKHTPAVERFNHMWREHLNAYGTNDQVHVDYCAWKCGVPVTYLMGHYRDNPYAKYDQHDHHIRRKPQFRLEADCADYLA
jgi:hypothetical protein